MAGYSPKPATAGILAAAWQHVTSVVYRVTLRWVFYRLLQDGWVRKKSDYGMLKGYLSEARKRWYGPWRPDSLADDTRAPVLMQRRGYYTLYVRDRGFVDEDHWLETLKEELNCPLDHWLDQPNYVELWFEAAAMQGQFLHYAHERVPLFAFRGDASIASKWDATKRLVDRWLYLEKPVYVLYYGDLDKKGLLIPWSVLTDVGIQAAYYMCRDLKLSDWEDRYKEFRKDFHFLRIGLNDETVADNMVLDDHTMPEGINDAHVGQHHIEDYGIQENLERPGTYQWEALSDEAARELIAKAEEYLDLDAVEATEAREDEIRERFKKRLEGKR